MTTQRVADALRNVLAVSDRKTDVYNEAHAALAEAATLKAAQGGVTDAMVEDGFDAWHDKRWPKPNAKHPHLQEAAEFHWRQQKATRREVWDAANAHANPALAGLRMALASQIEITNTERSRVEKLEAALSAQQGQGEGGALPAELCAWLQQRDLLPCTEEDGSFDIADLITALDGHEDALMTSTPPPSAPPAQPAERVPEGFMAAAQDAHAALSRMIAKSEAADVSEIAALARLSDLLAPSPARGDEEKSHG